MPKYFSTTDVKKLIAKFESISQVLTEICEEKQNALKRDVANAQQEILNSKVFSDSIIDDLRRGINRSPRTFATEALITSLYRYMLAYPIICEACNLIENHTHEISSSINNLKNATSNVRWLFSGSDSKANAKASYDYLIRLLEQGYEADVQKCYREITKYEKIGSDISFPEFINNPHTFQNALQKCVPNGLNGKNSLYAIIELLAKYQYIQKQYHITTQSCALKLTASEQNVHKAVNVALTSMALRQLREYDVETLNQKRPGIRTKLLRSAGYETIADIFTATRSNLSSINGISSDSAYQIKEAASEICEDVRTGLHLKISTDEKSKEATALVTALYSYRLYKSINTNIKNELETPFREIDAHAALLSTLQNNLIWIFATAKDKEQYSNSFKALSDFLSGEITSKVNNLTKQVGTSPDFSTSFVWQDFSTNSIVYFNTLEELIPGILGNGDMEYGLPEDLAREIQDQTFFPQGLKVTLRRYQEWGVKYILHQENVLLGDEMGLGKTIQAIATMVSLRNTGSKFFLVVCPASVLPNWCKEIDFKSEFRSTKVHGMNRQSAINDWITSGGVAVTTYETTGLITLPEGFKYDLLIVDEAHYIKNEGAQRSKNVRKLGEKAKRILFMTGTALENNVNEMVSLIRVLQPDIANQVQNKTFMSSAPQFREQIAPVYYRRKREDVLTELPDITESKEWCTLLPGEEDAYEQAVLNRNNALIRKVSWTCDDLNNSAKAQRMMEIISDAEEDNRKVLVFSFYLETIRKIQALLGDRCTQPINGSVPVERRQEIIDEFEKMPPGSVLLAQIQAGGTGLNIQSASVVIICEPQLKPSIENQAISRAYRMGQTRKVLVYRLLAENTIDERLDSLLGEKQAIFDAFADHSAAATATQIEEQQIDDKTFGKLILEEIERIKAKNGNVVENEQFVYEEMDQVSKKPEMEKENDEDETTEDIVDVPSSEQLDFFDSINSSDSEKQTVSNHSGTRESDISSSSPKNKEEKQGTTPKEEASFASIDEFMNYLMYNNITYVDNRPKNGCLWISSEGIGTFQNIRVSGKKLMFSKASKALGGKSGWYIS